MKISYDPETVAGENMNIAKEYFRKQWKHEEFKHFYLEEKVKRDIEYRMEVLKRDNESQKPQEELIKNVYLIERDGKVVRIPPEEIVVPEV